MRIVFLDIDGVLITGQSMRRNQDSRTPDPECVTQLNRLLAAAGAKIVVSSVWRFVKEDMAAELAGWGVRGEVIGRTPQLERRALGGILMSVQRGEEIQSWLDKHPQISEWVILDDGEDMGPLTPYLVRTDPVRGLGRAEVDMAIHMLGSWKEQGNEK